MGKFSGAIEDILNEDAGTKARSSALIAPAVSPDEMGKAMAVADRDGKPPAVVATNLREYDELDHLDTVTAAGKRTPALGRWLGDPNQAALARDDIGALSEVSTLVNNGLLSTARVIPGALLPFDILTAYQRKDTQAAEAAKGPQMRATPEAPWFSELIGDLQSGWYGGKQANAVTLPDFSSARTRSIEDVVGQSLGYTGRDEAQAARTGQAVAQFGREAQAASRTTQATEQAFQRLRDAEASGSTGNVVTAALNPRVVMSTVMQSLGATAPNLAISAAMPASRLMQAGATGTGSFTAEQGFTILDVMADAGVDTTDAGQVQRFLNNKPAMAAARRKGTERGIAVAVFDAATAGFAGRLLRNSRRTFLSPVVRTAGEGLVQAGGGAAGEATAQLASEGRIESVGDIVLEAAAETPTFLAEGRGQIAEARRFGELNADRFDAASEQSSITKLVDLSSKSKTRERSASRFESLIRSMTDQGDDTVYLSADGARKLFQSGAEGEPSALSGLIDPSALSEALATGGEIAIPLGQYAAYITPEDHAKVADQVRLQPGTRHDLPTVSAEEIQQAISDGLAAAQQEEERDTGPAGQVFDDIYGQLLTRQGEKLARQNATIVQSVYRNLAERVGTDAYTLFQQFRINLPGATRDVRGAPRGVDVDVDPLLDALRSGKLPTDEEIVGEGITTALARAGGLRPDEGGELAALEAGNRPGLISGSGMSLDDALVWAHENRFIEESPTQFRESFEGDAPDIQTLLDLLGQELGGTRVGRPSQRNVQREQFREDARRLQEELDQRGVDLGEVDNATARRALGMEPKFYQDAIPEPEDVASLKAKIAALEKELRTDELTGLRNRRAFNEDEALGWEGVMAFDMDSLTALNKLGHDVGDMALKAIGEVMLGSETDTARFYHTSGDEFYGRARTMAEARTLAQMIQDKLESVDLNIDVADADGNIRELTHKGIGVSRGAGSTPNEADQQAIRNKDEREAAGVRQAKGDPGPLRRLVDRRSAARGPDRRAGGDREPAAGEAPQDRLSIAPAALERMRKLGEDGYIRAISGGMDPQGHAEEFEWIQQPLPDNAKQVKAGVATLPDGRTVDLFEVDEREDDGALLLYAVADGEVVGTMGAGENDSELLVNPDYRRSGVGTALQTALRERDPFTPSGGLSPAGERLARQFYRRATSADRTLNQSPVDTEAFKAWSGGAPVYEGEELVTDYEGGPAVFVMYHGTTADFDAFDRERADIGSDMGAGFYFSNNPADVAPNYAGTGPDLTNKIEKRAEILAYQEELDGPTDEIKQRARAMYMAHEGATLKVYVKTENPAIVGGDNETRLTYEEEFDEETEEYGEPTGTLVDFVENLRSVAADFHEVDVEESISVLFSEGVDGDMALSTVIDTLAGSEGLQYATDDNGELASKEIIRRALEKTGFDAIVDYTVDVKFGSQRQVGKQMEGLDADTVHVIAFEPTQIKSATGNRGTFDPSDPNILNQSERGSVTFRNTPEGRQFDIQLLAGMDASTFVHELGHVYLEVLNDLAARDGAPAQITEDVATINAWLKREAGQPITTEQHEQFARGFEAYLREGKAPSSALRRVFAAFKVWLTAIYRSATQLNVDLSTEVREVFDRIVASDAEIAEARGEQYQEALITDAVAVGMSPEDFAAYNIAVGQARADAEAVVAAELLRAMQIEQKAWYREERKRVQAEVTTQLRESPAYRAQRLLRTGKLPDGTEAPKELQIKLDKNDLLDHYGQSFLRNLTGTYAVEGGVPSEEAADILGFRSGTELVDMLVNAPPLSEAIAAETDARMADRHPDPMTDGTLPDRAMVAAHRDRQADVMVREIRALEATTGRPVTQGAVVKGIAASIIANKKLRHLQPATYKAAEARAGKEAFEAAAKQDWPAAVAARRRQLLNFELFREAVRARNEATLAARNLAKYGETKTRARLGKAGGEYLAQIDALLDRFDFRNITNKAADRRSSLAAWIKLQSERGMELDLPDAVLDEAFRVPYRDLTMGQLREVRDAVKAIDHLARLKGKLLLGAETRDAAQIDAEMAASVLESTPKAKVTTGDELNRTKILRAFRQGRVIQATATDLARELDGFTAGGAVWRNTVGVIRDAINNRVNPELNKAQESLANVYLKHYTKEQIRDFGRLVPMPEVNGDLWSKRRLLALALNWGNDGNREAILSQAKARLTKGQVDALLGRLGAKDWAFVEEVWGLIDGYWPAISEAQKRRTGLSPEKVKASPFMVRTADGQTLSIPGGYYPLKYEADSIRTMKDEADDFWNSIRAGRSAKAATKNGHTIERVGSGGRTVALDTTLIQSHLRDVIRDLYLGDAVNYVHSVLNGSAFRQSIDATGQQEYAKALEVWLKDVAAGEIGPRVWHERAMRAVRTNFTASVLAFKPVSAALQITGIIQSSVVLGQADTWQGVAQYATKPIAMTRYVHEASPFMAARAQTHIEAVQQVMTAEQGKWSSAKASMIRFGYWLMGRVQQQVDIATWLAAENQGMRLFDNDVDKARAYADDAVSRAQSSGEFIDKNPIQRGTLGDNVRQSEWIKAASVLQSYMYSKGNAAYEITRKTNFKSPLQTTRWAMNMAMLFTVEAIVVAAIRGQLPDDDDDDGSGDEWAAFLAKQTLSNLFGAVPGGGVAVSEMRGYDAKGVMATAWESVSKFWTQAEQGEMDRAVTKAAVTVAGVTMGVPSAQINKTIDAVTASADGEDVSPYEFLTGPETKK